MIDKNIIDNYLNSKKQKLGSRFMLILLLSISNIAGALNLPISEDLTQKFGISQLDVANLNKGEIVFFNVAEAESDEKELAIGAIMYLPEKPTKVISLIKEKGWLSIDNEVLSEGIISPQAMLDDFKNFSFHSGSDEANLFLETAPGSQFNLSTQEFETIHQVDFTITDAASQAYQKILLKRWQDYRKNGLKGIAPYDRGNGAEANPESELLIATKSNKVLPLYFPELYNAWINYPAALPVGAEETFMWRNRQVEGRPTAILLHRIMLSTSAGELILSRQFYAGHSYNSNQLTIACLPYHDGSLIFYGNRTFTDQVAGLGSSLKHSIGLEQSKAEISKVLKKLEQVLKKNDYSGNN